MTWPAPRDNQGFPLCFEHMTGRPRQARKTTTAEVRPHAARRSPIWSPGSTALRVCAALVRRGRSGHGETVGASLNNGMISMLGFLAANYLATGEQPPRTGNDHAIVAPYGLFRTKDGAVALAPSQEQSYQRLVDALGMPELRDDPRLRTNDLRVANRRAINAAIEERLGSGTSDYWIEKLNGAGVPCDRVKSLPEVFADP